MPTTTTQRDRTRTEAAKRQTIDRRRARARKMVETGAISLPWLTMPAAPMPA